MRNLREKKDELWDAVVFDDEEKKMEILEQESTRRGWDYMSIRRLCAVIYLHQRDRKYSIYASRPEWLLKCWHEKMKKEKEKRGKNV